MIILFNRLKTRHNILYEYYKKKICDSFHYDYHFKFDFTTSRVAKVKNPSVILAIISISK